MLKNYLTTALRNLHKHKGYAFINITGLAGGLAACLLIVLYVQDERSYDRFHDNANRIYRVVTDIQPPGDAGHDKTTTNGWPVGRLLKADHPEVEEVVYLRTWWNPSFKHEGQYHYQNVLHADEHFFRVFSFPLLKGNPATALREPYTLILTDEMEQKYFGNESALGQTLILNDSLTFTVTGVARIPRHSHIQFDVLISFATICALGREDCDRRLVDGWGHVNVHNYVLLHEGVDGKAFEAKIENLVTDHAGEQIRAWGYTFTQRLEPLQDIYLRSDRGNELGPQSDITYVYLLSVIALFILLIACINFMNLATARSTERAKEVGVRKVVGSGRSALVQQFLSESFLTCLLAFILALGLLSLVLPVFNDLTGKALTTADLLSLRSALNLLVLVLLVGLLAGLYPAFMFSGFRPIEMLKGTYATSRRGLRLRQVLVVFQFAISCVLIVSTLVVLDQLRFMQRQDLGFDKEQVVVLDAREAPRRSVIEQYETVKRELAAHGSVQQVSASNVVPGRNGWRGQWSLPEGRADDEGLSLEYLPVDHDFVETFGVEVVAGRNFSTAFETDVAQAVLINTAAVEAIGWRTSEEAIGKRLASPGSGKPEGVVVGVVQDYHHHGLQEKIAPVMMGINPGTFRFFSLRVGTDDLPATLAHMETTWNRFFPGYTFQYFFLDDDFARQYEAEERLTKIFGAFAFLAILIACLGLFGLAAFTTVQRTKEIGIRKVFGATVSSLAFLLSKDFARLVLIGVALAAPLAYLTMNRWLENFAYRIDIGAGTFLIAGVLVLMIALLTVSYQSIKAALMNPVESLRYE